MSREQSLSILVVDDENAVLRSLIQALDDSGFKVCAAMDPITAMEVLRRQEIDLVISDIRLGELSGLTLFEKMRSESFQQPVIFISGNATLTEAVNAVRIGAADFIEKPFDPEKLILSVEKAMRLALLEQRLRNLTTNGTGLLLGRHGMVGSSPAMLDLLQKIDKVAPTRSRVLILGESGTGKELVARAIHTASSISHKPFVRVNCAAIPETLIESELFGHEKGAFTGATQTKKGLFEFADGGTIFLDEVGELSASAQAKILRVLQNGELQRLGGNHIIKVNVRVLAATHRDLAKGVEAQTFREDLYYRLSVVPLHTPSLRERIEDVPHLVSAFVLKHCLENGIAPKEIDAAAVDAICKMSWPGNIRQLENFVERLVIFSEDRITLSDVDRDKGTEIQVSKSTNAETSGYCRVVPGSISLRSFQQRAEREYLIATLQTANGVISEAAKLLDIERTYLHRKLKEFDIRKSEYFNA